jgi:flagella basal body P-ring formation protein FlgA
VADILAAAERFVSGTVPSGGRGLVLRAGRLDPRLRLPRCDRALEGYLPPGGQVGARTLVGVRCAGSRPWKVYVPVDVLEPRTVLVARRSLAPGHTLTAEDLVAEERDVSRLPNGYVEDPEQLVGRRLERRVAAGTVISPGMLEETVLVKRGQTVTLVVQGGSLLIRSAGLALADGSLDERIRVRNLASDRIVEGVVRSEQEVEVLVR